MRICIIGKYPPMQGLISTQTYWLAHDLACKGNEVHVVTDAIHIETQNRVQMLPEDWKKCESNFSNGGFVQVHWTNDKHNNRYNDWKKLCTSNINSTALEVVKKNKIDLIVSYYLEPYAITGHLVSQVTQTPHIVTHVGKNMDKLSLHSDYSKLYCNILCDADLIISNQAFVENLIAHGIKPNKIVMEPSRKIPTIFNTDNISVPDWLPIISKDTIVIGTYGKINKSSEIFILLQAIRDLKLKGHEIHLLIIGDGKPSCISYFNAMIHKYGINDVVTRHSFIPNWRMPCFIKACDAVYVLDHKFINQSQMSIPIQEVLACGKLLVCSNEILKKLPLSEKLIHGHNCVAINDVTDYKELSNKISLLYKCTSGDILAVGKNGAEYFKLYYNNTNYPKNIINLFEAVVSHSMPSRYRDIESQASQHDELIWSNLIIKEIKPHLIDENINLIYKPFSTINYLLSKLNCAYDKITSEMISELLLLERQILVSLKKQSLIFKGDGNVNNVDNIDINLNHYNNYLEQCIFKPIKSLMIKKYHYNPDEMLHARSSSILPKNLTKSTKYVITYKNNSLNGIKLIILDESSYKILKQFDGIKSTSDIIKNDCNVVFYDDRKKSLSIIFELVRLGILNIVNSFNIFEDNIAS